MLRPDWAVNDAVLVSWREGATGWGAETKCHDLGSLKLWEWALSQFRRLEVGSEGVGGPEDHLPPQPLGEDPPVLRPASAPHRALWLVAATP